MFKRLIAFIGFYAFFASAFVDAADRYKEIMAGLVPARYVYAADGDEELFSKKAFLPGALRVRYWTKDQLLSGRIRGILFKYKPIAFRGCWPTTRATSQATMASWDLTYHRDGQLLFSSDNRTFSYDSGFNARELLAIAHYARSRYNGVVSKPLRQHAVVRLKADPVCRQLAKRLKWDPMLYHPSLRTAGRMALLLAESDMFFSSSSIRSRVVFDESTRCKAIEDECRASLETAAEIRSCLYLNKCIDKMSLKARTDLAKINSWAITNLDEAPITASCNSSKLNIHGLLNFSYHAMAPYYQQGPEKIYRDLPYISAFTTKHQQRLWGNRSEYRSLLRFYHTQALLRALKVSNPSAFQRLHRQLSLAARSVVADPLLAVGVPEAVWRNPSLKRWVSVYARMCLRRRSER